MDAYCYGVILFLIVQCLAAAIRVYIRVFMLKRFGWDDMAMIITLILSSAFGSLALAIAATTGLEPVNKIAPGNLIPSMRMTLAVELVYICGSVFLKIALGLLLLRVLVTGWQKLIIHTTVFISVAYGIFYFLFILLQCGAPTEFEKKIVFGQCLSATAINGTSFTHAALNALADLVFLFLPVALLRKADMSRRSKLSVGSILGLGSFGGICTVTSKIIVLMSAAELSIGLTCICLSTFKPLIRLCFSTNEYSHYGYQLSSCQNESREDIIQTNRGEPEAPHNNQFCSAEGAYRSEENLDSIGEAGCAKLAQYTIEDASSVMSRPTSPETTVKAS